MSNSTLEGKKKTENGVKRLIFSVLAILFQVGFMLMVFPEGTRVRKKNRGARPKGGVAMMAIRAGAKLMPIYIGTKKRLFAKVPIIFGKPFTPEYTGRKGTVEEYQANADEVIRRAYELGGETWT